MMMHYTMLASAHMSTIATGTVTPHLVDALLYLRDFRFNVMTRVVPSATSWSPWYRPTNDNVNT
jgi:hypothetical protein